MNSLNELKNFLKSKNGLRMSHIYKPIMLLTVIRNGGAASKEEIAKSFVLSNSDQISYYKNKVVHPMPGNRLVRDGLLEKDGDTYRLSGLLSQLNTEEMAEIEEILKQRVSDYLEIRNPFGDQNLDAVPGNLRFEVLRDAGGRCELCGTSSKEKQIDVDHIIPRANGGSNDRSNLQALCRTCNAQKRARDDTNFIEVHASYDEREQDCIFCQLEGSKERHIYVNNSPIENELAFAIYDGFAVTEGHTLIIPKRHVPDYFDLHNAEHNAIEQLLKQQRELLLANDPTITGWNVGINAGISAGQTVHHVHIHLIPRRDGDMEDPRGGVRGVIPSKQKY